VEAVSFLCSYIEDTWAPSFVASVKNNNKYYKRKKRKKRKGRNRPLNLKPCFPFSGVTEFIRPIPEQGAGKRVATECIAL